MLRSLPTTLLFIIITCTSIAQPSKTSTNFYNEGVKLMETKNYADALTAFKNAIAQKPDYADAFYEAGWCSNELQKYNDATFYLEKAKKLDATNQKIWFELAYASEKLQKTDDAIVYYKKTLELYPDYTGALRNLGNIYYNKEDYKTALDYYSKYLGYQDIDNSYFYKAAWCANDLGKYNDAVNYLGKYSPTETDDLAKKYSETGFSNLKLKDGEAAVAAYKKALDVKPDYAPALRGLGDTYKGLLKQNTDAINYYEAAIKTDEEGSKSCYYNLGWLYNEEEKYSDAVSVLLKAIDYNEKDPGNREELGYAYYKLDKYDDAIYQLKKATELDNQSKLGYYYLGLCYVEINDKTKAMEVYNKLKTINEEQAQKLLDKINGK